MKDGTTVLRRKLEKMARPGYKAQRSRRFAGLKLVQVGSGGGRWQTEDGRWYIERYEGDFGGWRLFGPGIDGEMFCGSLRGAAREIQRAIIRIVAAEQ